MKDSIDTFLLGLNDLREFLRNAKRETALTALMLREPRFSSVSEDEQCLITAISKAGTEKRRYLYAVAIIGLYGLLERYMDSVLERYITLLSKSVSHYDQLPESVRKNHLPASLELLKAINDETYHGDADAISVIANLHSCLSTPSTFRLNGDAFVFHRGNISLDKIRGFFGSLGVMSPIRRLSLMPAFEKFFSESEPPRYPQSVSDDDLNLMLSPINDLVDRRNAIAHGVVDDIESVNLLLSRGDFLLAFVQAVHELLQHELLPFEIAAPEVQALGQPIDVFDGKIVCFESSTCRLAVGDRIVAQTGDSLMPFRAGEVLDIQVNHVSYNQLQPTEATKFCVKISFKARNNHSFFVLKPTNSRQSLQLSLTVPVGVETASA